MEPFWNDYINPKDCRRWQYADRSSFEMGDLFLLAEDIKQNGQIEPIIVRSLKGSSELKYEVIAGSRRWQACLQHNLPLKAIVRIFFFSSFSLFNFVHFFVNGGDFLWVSIFL